MKTIKTYTPITVEQAGELLRENGWKPVEGLAMKNESMDDWRGCGNAILSGVNTYVKPYTHYGFEMNGESNWKQCATVTEINPCQSPDGCPELEPWMAYVGTKPSVIIPPIEQPMGRYFISWENGMCWENTGVDGSNTGRHHAIDVRKAWSQNNYPDHCSIRAYVEPDAFEAGWASRVKVGIPKSEARHYYELGQANPKKGE